MRPSVSDRPPARLKVEVPVRIWRGNRMKAYSEIALGFLALLAPLWTLSGFVAVPEYRTGTIADFAMALIAGVMLYGGVFVDVLVGRSRLNGPVSFKATFVAGMAGVMGAITLALVASFLIELITTGRLMPAGQTPALLPMFYVVGGVLSSVIAAGAGLIAHGLSRE